jgi:general secretion pathway protein A
MKEKHNSFLALAASTMATKSSFVSSSSRSADSYYPSPLHEEALARLAYLAEKGSSCGILLGPSGCGKSLILSRFAQHQRRQGAAVAAVSALGASASEMLLEIGTSWGARVQHTDELPYLWQKTTDRLRELSFEQVSALLIVDDLHLALAEGASLLDRLCAFADGSGSSLGLVIACEGGHQGLLTSRILSRAELRVELDAWTLGETAEFLQQWLTQTSGESQGFDDQAIEVLHDLADGNPRRVRQLAELTQLAGSGISEGPVGEGVVQAAYEELCVGR